MGAGASRAQGLGGRQSSRLARTGLGHGEYVPRSLHKTSVGILFTKYFVAALAARFGQAAFMPGSGALIRPYLPA